MVLGNLVIGLGMALNGFEIWSYVFALLSQNAILGVCYWIAHPGPIGIKMDGSALREMVGYGGRSTIFNMLNYAAGKVDTMIVAAHSTDWKLTGFYDRSSYLMGLPVTVLGKLGDSVLFSGMSMLQDELDRLRNTVLKASYALSTLVIPLTALLVLRAENFTVLILGPLYVEATPIVEVLFLCVALRSFIKIGDASMRATDSLISGTLIKLGFLIAVSAGVWYSKDLVIVAAAAVVYATLAQTLAVALWMVASLKVSLPRLLKSLLPGILLSLPVIGIDYLFKSGIIDMAMLLPSCEVDELIQILKIAYVMLGAGTIALITAVAVPEILDGGFPEMRRQLMGKLPESKIKQRLTR